MDHVHQENIFHDLSIHVQHDFDGYDVVWLILKYDDDQNDDEDAIDRQYDSKILLKKESDIDSSNGMSLKTNVLSSGGPSSSPWIERCLKYLLFLAQSSVCQSHVYSHYHNLLEILIFLLRFVYFVYVFQSSSFHDNYSTKFSYSYEMV